MGKTKIEWTDNSWNPIRARFWEIQDDGSGKERIGHHCEKVSEACRNCYAEPINKRLGTGLEYKPGNLYRPEREGYNNGEAKVFLDERVLLEMLRWRKPRRIFVCSMTDLFGDWVPDEWIDRVFAVMALAPQHQFQVLTKRPKRMREYFAGIPEMNEPAARDALIEGCAQAIYAEMRPDEAHSVSEWLAVHMPLPNVWLGVSAEDQKTADERIPELVATPAAVRFASLEPLLGAIEVGEHVWAHECHECFNGRTRMHGHFFDERCPACNGSGVEKARLDWVICGGESGPRARPMHLDWARKIRNDCEVAGVPFFFKQWGEWLPWHQFSGDVADDTEQTKFHTLEWSGNCWRDVGKPMWCDSFDGAIVDDDCVGRVGKKVAGRLLDGVEHNGMPEVRA